MKRNQATYRHAKHPWIIVTVRGTLWPRSIWCSRCNVSAIIFNAAKHNAQQKKFVTKHKNCEEPK